MIITNNDLKGTIAAGASEFYHTALIHFDNNEIHLEFTKHHMVVIRDAQRRAQLNSAFNAFGGVAPYHTRLEFQSPEHNAALTHNLRLVNVGTLIAINTGNQVLFPLLERNGSTHEAGCWTQPSGLVSEDPRVALQRETDEELGLITSNGKIIVMNDNPDHMKTICNYKQSAASRNPKLKAAFDMASALGESALMHIPSTQLYDNLRTPVNFEGIYHGRDSYVVIDNPGTRTVTLADIREIALKDAFEMIDPENLGRTTGLFTLDDMADAQFTKTHALKELVARITAQPV